MKQFYNACDGVLFFWAVSDPEQEDATKVISGKIHINPLEQLLSLSDTIVIDDEGIRLGLDSKIFILEPTDSSGNVIERKIYFLNILFQIKVRFRLL